VAIKQLIYRLLLALAEVRKSELVFKLF